MSWNSGPMRAEASPASDRTFLGRGTYGTVYRMQWNNQTVAVKEMEYSDEQKMTFQNEIDLLRKVKHKNIIRLIGHSITDTLCILIMEYAECGNLYDLLHNSPAVHYDMKHALSWCHQTAQALAYLHNLKPRPLVHRDVKPPNLLLMNWCRVIKICDFGTACDVHTHMTTNKGSAAWMAPEVFNSTFNSYTEKCDTFSFGITMWQVMARKKPFADQGSAFAIMWAVNNGIRPPLLQNCPLALEELVTLCWDSNPQTRPSMSQVERRLKQITDLIEDGEEPKPIVLPEKKSRTDSSFSSFTESLPNGTATEPPHWNSNLYSYLHRYGGEPVTFPNTDPGGSRESLLDEGPAVSVPRRRPQPDSQPLPQVPDRRPRSSSFNNNTNSNPPAPDYRPKNLETTASDHRFQSSTGPPVRYDDVSPPALYAPPPASSGAIQSLIRVLGQDEGYRTGPPALHRHQVYVKEIDAKYRPLQPDANNDMSMSIFRRHQEECAKFNRYNTEHKLLQEREKEIAIMERHGVQNFNLDDELRHANTDKESLTKFRDNLLKQLKKLQQKELRKEAAKDDFELIA